MVVVGIAFFSTTLPLKKMMLCCRHLPLLFKHNKEGDGSLLPSLLQQKPEKKMMAHYCFLFLLKHKEEGDGRSCCHLLHYNRTREEDDDALPLSFSSQT